jgi:membrane protease YdiL (CAAX protease family)
MFDWRLMLLLVAVCLPGIGLAIPRSLQVMEKKLAQLRSEGRKIPPDGVIVALQAAQSVLLVLGVSALGIFLSRSTGLGAPFFSALITGSGVGETLESQVLAALGAGAGGATVFLLLYYLVFRRILDDETVSSMEALRSRLGLAGRMLYGGIVEELLIRWGLMNLLVWLFARIFGEITTGVMWAALITSGLLFGAGHLPAYLQAGCRKTPAFYTSMFALNLWGSVIFGWLFMRYGLLAAMIAHAVFHLMWYPLDILVSSRTKAEARPS